MKQFIIEVGSSTKHNSSCLLKAADDEPIFVLRAKDPMAPTTVRQWIVNVGSSQPPEKLIGALQVAYEMEHWLNGENIPVKQKTGIQLIAEERQEQIKKHGWSKKHDSGHLFGELAIVAATLAVMGTDASVVDPSNEWGSGDNPWNLEEKLKPNPIHALKVAGALIAAELDRLLQV